MSAQVLHLAARDEAGLEPLDLVDDRSQRLLGHLVRRRDGDHAEPGALPEVLMGDFGDRDVERA